MKPARKFCVEGGTNDVQCECLSFFLSAAEPSSSDSLREIIRLLRNGWVVVESRPIHIACPENAPLPALRGPANLIVLVKRQATDSIAETDFDATASASGKVLCEAELHHLL